MTANTNILLTTEAWAEITIKEWLAKIDKLGIGRYSWHDVYSGDLSLVDTFIHHIISSSGGNIDRIEFAFNYYGKFVDMGVGKGVKLSDVKELGASRYFEGRGSGNRRKPKKWFSKTFYSQVQRLKEILAEKYAQKSALTIVENLDDNALKWEKQHKKI